MAKILIVDDDAHIRELARLFLRNEGFDVYEAEDGLQALTLLESVKVDMAILDVMMLNMDDMHDGTIEVNSAQGKGTEVIVSFSCELPAQS